jgi:hypothetical protein
MPAARTASLSPAPAPKRPPDPGALPPASPVTLRRLRTQLLTGAGARSPLAVAQRLLAIQAQDLRGARLAIRARLADGSGSSAIDHELTERRSLVVSWLNRGTLHLVRSEDYPLLQALTTPPVVTAVARRLSQEGVTPRQAERGVAEIDRVLGDEGPLGRGALRDRLQTAGVSVGGQALVHLLVRASLEGRILRGPVRDGEHCFVRVADWLGPTPPVDREHAVAELARRYLAGHGPAGDRDLARWAGITLRQARTGLAAIAGQLRDAGDGLLELARSPARAPAPPPPRLLGAFEPVLMGWTSRAGVLGDAESRIVSGGIFRPFALVGGRGAAGWRFEGGVRGISIEPFGALSDEDAVALAREADAVRGFLAA